MVGTGSQYTGTCVLIFLTSVLCIVDFMTIKLFDLNFYFDGFNALVYSVLTTQHAPWTVPVSAPFIVDVPIRFALAGECVRSVGVYEDPPPWRNHHTPTTCIITI